MTERVLLIINPVAGKGRGKKLEHKITRLAKSTYPEIDIYFTLEKNDACHFMRKNHATYQKVFVAGGDGTLNEICNSLPENPGFILYVLPIGSGNDFARANGLISRKHEDIFTHSKNGVFKTCDYGTITVITSSNQRIQSNFFSSCGSGFDAQVSKISNRKTFLTGLPLYISSVFKALTALSFVDVTVTIHDRTEAGEKLLVAVGNTATSGGGFRLTPHADISDGKLDIMIAEKMRVHEIIRLLPKAIFGKHLLDKRVVYTQGETIKMEYKTPAIIHRDGELLTEEASSAEINIKKASVRLGVIP